MWEIPGRNRQKRNKRNRKVFKDAFEPSNRETNAETTSCAWWTKSYLINLHCVYIYIHIHIYLYILHIIYISVVALFSDDWLLSFDDKIHFSLPVESRLSFDITFSIYYFIYVRASSSLRKNEIKLMFFPKSHILFAEEGRPIGPIDWWCAMIERWRCTRWALLEVKWHQVVSEVSRVRERAALALGCTPIYHTTYLPPAIYYSRAVIRGEFPVKIPVIGCRAHGPILSS